MEWNLFEQQPVKIVLLLGGSQPSVFTGALAAVFRYGKEIVFVDIRYDYNMYGPGPWYILPAPRWSPSMECYKVKHPVTGDEYFFELPDQEILDAWERWKAESPEAWKREKIKKHTIENSGIIRNPEKLE